MMKLVELDVGGYRHQSICDNLADDLYKNVGVSTTGEGHDNGEDNSHLDVTQSPHLLYDSENSEDFDQHDRQGIAAFGGLG